MKSLNDDFFMQVWKLASLIPYGRVTSYGAIANALGKTNASRMVGWAMSKSSLAPFNVPAHRVVNRIGVLTGRNSFEEPFLMEKLLKQEGVEVKNNKVVKFEKLFWNPMQELDF